MVKKDISKMTPAEIKAETKRVRALIEKKKALIAKLKAKKKDGQGK